MIMHGTKVTLRSPTMDDATRFIDAVQRSKDMHTPWVSPPSSHAEYARYLEECSRENHCAFFVTERETGVLVGVYNLSNIIRGCFQNAFLGYYGFFPNAKKGYMTEALALVINYAFFTLGLHRIEANIQPKNVASIALVKRQGFIEEGYAKHYLRVQGR